MGISASSRPQSSLTAASDPAPSRRSFLAGAGGLIFALALGGLGEGSRAADLASAAPGSSPATALETAWVKIHTDGTVEIAFPASEMGQGSMTGLSMVIAEELDADWSRVKVFVPPNVAAIYGNPHWGNSLSTFGSFTIMGYWDKVRLQGAAVRQVLLQAAAGRWQVPVTELRTEPGAVLHDATSRRLGYGEIAGFATVPAVLPTVEKSALKRPADYRIVGHATPRVDIPAKTDGSAIFGIDARLSGMIYATFIGSPVEGAKVESVDGAQAEKVPGVTQVLKIGSGVAVLGTSVEAVFAGRDLVQVGWSKAERDGYDSVATLKTYQQRAADLSDKGLVWVGKGDAEKALSAAATTVNAAYTTDHVYHAQMEPMSATASVSTAGDAVEIWVSTQAQSAVIGLAAELLKIPPERVTVRHQYVGGGFGRRAGVDFIPEALLLSRQLKRPVKMIWTREQDVRAAKMRPMTAHYLSAGFDAAGTMTAWRHRIVAESIIGFRSEKGLEAAKGLDFLIMIDSECPYDAADQAVTYHREKFGTPLSAYRGIGSGHNTFAREAFVDELAAARRMDPVAFRLSRLAGNPRAQAVIRATAEMAGWGTAPPAGRARGFAFGKVVDSWIAAVVEISLDRETGEIRAHQVWTTIDPGVAVNPDSVRAQTEGNVVFGLSGALKERITLAEGRVEQGNYYDYEVLRMSDVPEIHIKVTPTDNPPTGIGEAGLPLMAPAVASAFFALTGKRLRQMPFNPERVKTALTAV